jgi:hypothetical protein
VKHLHAPHVGGHQINGGVQDALIQRAITTLTNEQGADSLKPQRGIGVPPHLEIIFNRGERSIPSHMRQAPSPIRIISRLFLEDFQ